MQGAGCGQVGGYHQGGRCRGGAGVRVQGAGCRVQGVRYLMWVVQAFKPKPSTPGRRGIVRFTRPNVPTLFNGALYSLFTIHRCPLFTIHYSPVPLPSLTGAPGCTCPSRPLPRLPSAPSASVSHAAENRSMLSRRSRMGISPW